MKCHACGQEIELSVGSFIRNERIKKGLSTRKLATLTGLGNGTISEIENNIHTPRPETLLKLKKVLE
jgi:transcriptional regulator with XRE-family HTH domain